MLIVITPEIDLENETVLVNELFQSGLECLHVRKPHKNTVEMMKYIDDIDILHHKKIVLHSFHELAVAFDLKGIHYSEMSRIAQSDLEKHIRKYSDKGFTVSTSYHDVKEIDSNSVFDYVFLSPIFDSISKDGYKGKQDDVNGINSTIIALGGITKDNISKVISLGYNGIAVLGSVWMDNNPIKAFSSINNSYQCIV